MFLKWYHKTVFREKLQMYFFCSRRHSILPVPKDVNSLEIFGNATVAAFKWRSHEPERVHVFLGFVKNRSFGNKSAKIYGWVPLDLEPKEGETR